MAKHNPGQLSHLKLNDEPDEDQNEKLHFQLIQVLGLVDSDKN